LNLKYYFIFLLVFIISATCAQRTSGKNVALNESEDFDEFLENFSTVKEFQITRVVFPFPDCTFPGDKNSHCDTLTKSNWTYLQLLDVSHSPIMITKLYDNFQLEMKNTGERVLSFEAVGTSVCSLYFFKQINGKWYLVKRLVCGDD
jgi:hypothetical protein